MSDVVVQGVRVERGVVVEDGHGRVVREVGLVQHLEHVVAAHLEERGPHPANVLQLHPSVQVEDLSLTVDLLGPVVDGEFLSVTVPVGRRPKKGLVRKFAGRWQHHILN